jgi:hypothetical protein
MIRPVFLLTTVALTAGLAPSAPKGDLTRIAAVEFRGEVKGELDVSGVAAVGGGKYLVIAADETPVAQVLRKDDDNTYTVIHDIKLGDPDHELDLEAVAAEGNTVYVTGSHNRVRFIGAKGGGGVTPIEEKPRKHRDQVFRFTLGTDGKPGPVEVMSLRATLDSHPILRQFVPVASKENGIDIEGLAVKNGRLFFGFRGPVLRDNWVPVLSCKFGKVPTDVKVMYLQLAGRGIRDLAAVKDGFLVLAGPVGDGDASFRIYFWDGKDGLDPAAKGERPLQLAEIPDVKKGKAEGLAVLNEDGKSYELMLVWDGLPKGGPARYRITRP